MRNVKNEQTGVVEKQFGGTLISISDKILKNSNGKEYKVATVEFEDINEKVQRCTALVYEGNYSKGIEEGETYLCTATPTEQGVIVKMSHLTYNGDRATPDMFGMDVVEEGSADPVKQANTAFETAE